MNTNKLLSWLLWLMGEAIIIAAFILFRGKLATDILVVNIVVSGIIYGLFFIDILIPWVDFKDRSHKRVGAIGLRWFVTWFYAVLAIAVMILGNVVYDWSFTTQLLIQIGLLFILLLGMLGVLSASNKVHEVYIAQTASMSRVADMKNAVNSLKDKIYNTKDLPIKFTDRIAALEDNVRYLSPTDNRQAYELEQKFIDTIHTIEVALTNYSLNEEQIENNLNTCERIFQNRKQLYSN